MNKGAQIPDQVAPPTGPDKLQGIEIQWNYFSLKAWKRQCQLSTQSSIHFSSPAEERRKKYKSGRHDRIERQVNVLKELSCEIDSLRRTIEGKKFATKEEVQEIEKWSDEVEAKISEADDDVLHLGKWIEKLKWEDSQKLRERELEYEWTLFKTWLKFQSELYAAKFQDHQGGVAENCRINSATGLKAKLPKLVIIKFNGTFQDWPWFWGQYSKATDKLSFASKFSYLRELLAPKVRTSIKALRF